MLHSETSGAPICRIKGVLATPWLPHLLHLKLQDNLVTHMGPLPNVPFLQTLDLSFNHISECGVVRTLASFQHLRSLRVNDNPVQHEPDFYFSLQRLMPWTQHEFGHARFFPDDQQIRRIQQEAVLNSPEAVQAYRQGQWGIWAVPGQQEAFSPAELSVTLSSMDTASDDGMDRRDSAGLHAMGQQDGAGADQSGPASGSCHSQHSLMMLEGAARRLHRGQVGMLLFRLVKCANWTDMYAPGSYMLFSVVCSTHARWAWSSPYIGCIGSCVLTQLRNSTIDLGKLPNHRTKILGMHHRRIHPCRAPASQWLLDAAQLSVLYRIWYCLSLLMTTTCLQHLSRKLTTATATITDPMLRNLHPTCASMPPA